MILNKSVLDRKKEIMEKSKRARPSGGKHLGYFRELSFIKGVFYPEDV